MTSHICIRRYLIVVLASLISAGYNVQADFTVSTPTNLGPNVNGSSIDEGPSISPDGLTLYYNSNRAGGYGSFDLWMATRIAKEDTWGQPENLGSTVNSSARDMFPSISADGLTLYFSSNRSGIYDLWVTTRATKDDPWSSPVILGSQVGSGFGPNISADGLSLYFGSPRSSGYGIDDIWVSTRITKDAPWQTPVNLGSDVNGSSMELSPCISSDGRLLFFSDGVNAPFRPGGYGSGDLWVTRRSSPSGSWGMPMNLGPTINGPAFEGAANISSDGSMLYFMSGRSGGYGSWDLWQAPILPVVDFTGDYRVNIRDLILLIEHWGQNEPAYDMGPMPWGDGVIDAADLEILMSYYGQALFDPHFLSHWKLDETEGMHAKDSIGDNHGVVLGNPMWQPENGQVQGALECDGIDDMIILTSGLNPADGPFSIFARIKGGGPGQVIISQQSGVNWLQVDAEGKLMTKLTKSGGRVTGSPLYSETVITDGNWHRVGFVWDGFQRILYVDDIPVALDNQDSLGSSAGGLAIGVGTGNQAGTFWSGTIDDVRIYNRVVEP